MPSPTSTRWLTIATATATFLLTACASTRVVDSWTAPGVTPADLTFEHIVAIAAVEDATSRRIAEDTLASSATRSRVTAAYTIVSDADRADVDRLRAALNRQGIDGAVTVRLVGVEDRETYVPGTTRVVGGGYYGYWGHYGTVIHEPGYYRTDTYVRIETTLHDVASGKLLWAGISESMNPSDVRGTIREVVEAARSDLQKQGLMP